MEFRVHWLALTVWGSPEHAQQIWKAWFEKSLGVMLDQGYGVRLYQKLYKALAEAKMYVSPRYASKDDDHSHHFHIELPGSACEALHPELIQKFFLVMEQAEKFQVTRLDLAWDGVPFTPEQMNEASIKELFRTYAKRDSFNIETWHSKRKDDGQIGQAIFRMGSRQSSRYVRVYNRRGPVRLELEARDKRADRIAKDVLVNAPDDWSDKAIPHLRDYVDVDADFWREFVQEHARANLTITDARTKQASKSTKWLFKQTGASLSVMVDIYGPGFVEALIQYGRSKRGNRFDSLLNGWDIEPSY
jgi:DNA relaxase NicK